MNKIMAAICSFSILAFSQVTYAKTSYEKSLSEKKAAKEIIYQGSVIDRQIKSTILKKNKVNLNLERNLKIFLPQGYHQSNKLYPVVYHIIGLGWSNKQMFEDSKTTRILNMSMQDKQSREFIFVAPDFTTDGLGSFFGNNEVSGYWLDHMVKEVVPYIDKEFRTLAKKESRALTGDNTGAYGAFKLAMFNPDVFSSVYAMHPVGTGTGNGLMYGRANWHLLNTAKSWHDLKDDGLSRVFLLMAQNHAPNPNKPPFYADLMLDLIDEDLIINAKTVKHLKHRFFLSELVPNYIDNLKQLRGIKMDWGRYDPIDDHVVSNQKFTRILHEYGIEHEAEEYSGGAWQKNWIDGGRVYEDVMPFLNDYLDFE